MTNIEMPSSDERVADEQRPARATESSSPAMISGSTSAAPAAEAVNNE